MDDLNGYRHVILFCAPLKGQACPLIFSSWAMEPELLAANDAGRLQSVQRCVGPCLRMALVPLRAEAGGSARG